MKDLIERIARALVDNPEEVTVTALEGNQATVLPKRISEKLSESKAARQDRCERF